MIRLLARTSALAAVFAVAILLARLAGSIHPAPDRYSILFTNPDSSPCEIPCILGVQPGTATIDSAVRTLRRHPFSRGMRESVSRPGIVTFQANGIGITVASEYRSSPDVQTIYLWFCRSQSFDVGTLTDAIIALGHPESVLAVVSGGCENRAYTEVYHRDKGIIVYYEWSTPDAISLGDRPFAIKAVKAVRGEVIWRGFGRVERYLRQP
jgi:hypothetical protein